MRTLIFVFIILLSVSLFSQEIPLSHQMDAKELELYKNYIPPLISFQNFNPPPNSVRAMAEWEELAGIMITWTSFQNILSQIVDHAQEEGKVWIVCSDSNTVINYLNNQNIPLHNIVFLLETYNSIWIRDYGPWTVYANNSDSLYIVDWIYNRPRPFDDIIPVAFASYINAPYYGTITPPYDLVHTGGNFMTDGHGNGFSSKLIFNENPGKTEAEIDTIMQTFLGISQFIKMDNLPYDVIHHIDMHMKLLDEETLLVGEYPPGVADGPQIEANLQYILNNFTTCYGRPYKVVRIPMPPDGSGLYPNQNGDYRTYTNSLIVNKTVIIPTYEQQYDTTAFRIYRQAMPGYNIVGINSNSIIPYLGTIHCITKEVGAQNPIFISHKNLESVSDTLNEYSIQALIKHNQLLDSVVVYWSTDTSSGFNSSIMTSMTNDSFEVEIPQQSPGSKIFYYIEAYSELGKSISKPRTAPQWCFQFSVENPNQIHDQDNIAISFELFQNYPNPFNPKTTIRYTLPEYAEVNLSIYNALGQKVKTLVSQHQSAGKHQVEWHASNFASGVYYYRLETDQGIIGTKKLILLK